MARSITFSDNDCQAEIREDGLFISLVLYLCLNLGDSAFNALQVIPVFIQNHTPLILILIFIIFEWGFPEVLSLHPEKTTSPQKYL